MALQQMASIKSPTSDGISACFYLAYQSIVGEEICSVALRFHNECVFDSRINFTYVVLIPKNKNPYKPSEHRPISLYNVIYKIVSKALANRLKKILPEIISPNQSAFIPRRLISDNVIVVYETLHTIQTR